MQSLTASTADVAAPSSGAPQAKMRLHAVCEAGRVVDFTWQYASPAAARLLGCNVRTLPGQSLGELITWALDHPALVDLYGRVFQFGNTQSFEQVHLVEGLQDVVVHRVVRLGSGVEVTLTNLSAQRRSRIARHETYLLRSSHSSYLC
jgi:hypothetical protein